jgi:hypothetical protein
MSRNIVYFYEDSDVKYAAEMMEKIRSEGCPCWIKIRTSSASFHWAIWWCEQARILWPDESWNAFPNRHDNSVSMTEVTVAWQLQLSLQKYENAIVNHLPRQRFRLQHF